METKLINLKFPKGFVELYLSDGRMMKVPLNLFPDIKNLSDNDRKHWQILDGEGFTFKNSNEGFHLRQFGLN